MTPKPDSTPAQQEFWSRLHAEWLPAYCNDPKRRYSVEGFSRGSVDVSDIDARDFLRAIDHHVVSAGAGGRIRMPQSKTHEVIFWEHEVGVVPRTPKQPFLPTAFPLAPYHLRRSASTAQQSLLVFLWPNRLTVSTYFSISALKLSPSALPRMTGHAILPNPGSGR